MSYSGNDFYQKKKMTRMLLLEERLYRTEARTEKHRAAIQRNIRKAEEIKQMFKKIVFDTDDCITSTIMELLN